MLSITSATNTSLLKSEAGYQDCLHGWSAAMGHSRSSTLVTTLFSASVECNRETLWAHWLSPWPCTPSWRGSRTRYPPSTSMLGTLMTALCGTPADLARALHIVEGRRTSSRPPPEQEKVPPVHLARCSWPPKSPSC